MKYEIILYWSEDDNAYIAEVPELAGCMADGPTAREALHSVEQNERTGVIALRYTWAGTRTGSGNTKASTPSPRRS